MNSDVRFNCRFLFEYFDTRKQDYLTFDEFKRSLNKLDMQFLDDTDCYNLFARVANDEEQLGYSEFHELTLGYNDIP